MKFKIQTTVFLLIFLNLFIGCDIEDKPEEPKLPEVTTVTGESEAVTTFTSVEITGTVHENELTSYGVVWASTPTPTLNDNISLPGENSAKATGKKRETKQSQNNSFTVKITNLMPGETYYFRTFGTNEAGTAYGEELSIGIPTLAETSWEITFDQNTNYPYLAQVTFYQNGTVYTDFEIPELNDFWGMWSMEGNHLTYQVHEDFEDTYILTGEVRENEMSGTYSVYSEGEKQERTYTGELLSSEAD